VASRNYMADPNGSAVNSLKNKSLGFGTPCATFCTFPSSDRDSLLG
jgi:hypothetical protein